MRFGILPVLPLGWFHIIPRSSEQLPNPFQTCIKVCKIPPLLSRPPKTAPFHLHHFYYLQDKTTPSICYKTDEYSPQHRWCLSSFPLNRCPQNFQDLRPYTYSSRHPVFESDHDNQQSIHILYLHISDWFSQLPAKVHALLALYQCTAPDIAARQNL